MQQPGGLWLPLITPFRLVELPRLLFAEPSLGPIKPWLWRAGLIDSGEVRLPMTSVCDALAIRIDQAVAGAAV
jgi:4-hydroxy-tetrahydrodipicolinate synthase